MKSDEVFLHETYADNGTDRVVYEYPKKLLDDFCEFVIRPNRFVFEQNTEMVLERIRKLRREMINTRQRHKVDTAADFVPVDAPWPGKHKDLTSMDDVELLAHYEEVGRMLTQRTSPVWLEPLPDVAGEPVTAGLSNDLDEAFGPQT